MKQTVISLLILGLILAALAGCNPKSKSPQPPEIHYGQETCSACGMVIDDPRFAAATLLENGEYLKFDDAGEMLAYFKKHPQTQVAAWFVHDYPSQSWMRGEEAFFVQSTSLQTPMGSRVATFASRAEAEAFAVERDGEVFSLDQIRTQVSMKAHP
jgi:copper chaperone NosL